MASAAAPITGPGLIATQATPAGSKLDAEASLSFSVTGGDVPVVVEIVDSTGKVLFSCTATTVGGSLSMLFGGSNSYALPSFVQVKIVTPSALLSSTLNSLSA